MIAFAKTKAERLASGDPRLSVEERYPAFSVYAAKVKNAVDDTSSLRCPFWKATRSTPDVLTN
jgi:hypothetical protein